MRASVVAPARLPCFDILDAEAELASDADRGRRIAAVSKSVDNLRRHVEPLGELSYFQHPVGWHRYLLGNPSPPTFLDCSGRVIYSLGMQQQKGKLKGPLLSKAQPGDPRRIAIGHDDFPGWTFTVGFGDIGDVTSFSIDAHGKDVRRRAPLNYALVHAVPAGAIIERARIIASAHARMRAREASGGQRGFTYPTPDPVAAESLKHWSALVAERTGTRGKDDRVYAHVAAQYVEILQTGVRAPLRELAERLGVGESRARNLVYEARQRGLLTATKQGVKGGRLTAKANRLIEAGRALKWPT